ncbi:hypothetical protein ACIRPX_21720 [Streptomyces sp. NPDC101225]|uniref:hypothetical protein n=1 Tax=Streptomyces sp. NPDC101225 TaxID=3366135 RepID=UPI0038206E96
MTSIPELYTREMHTKYEYLACWLPSTRLAVGDVGLVARHRFRKLTTLSELGIPFTREADSPISDLNYSSTDYVAVTSDARPGASTSDAVSHLSISFARSGATLFQASGCVLETIGNLPALEAALRTAHEDGTWRLKYVVVTEVVRTGPTAVLVAEHRGAQLDLQVSTGGLTGLLPVADATAKCQVTNRLGIAADVLAPTGATPLFNAVQLRKRLLGQYELVFRSDDDDDGVSGDDDSQGADCETGDPDEQNETEMARVTWADLARDDTDGPTNERALDLRRH